ncbi:MAG: c-type cytochrome [Acidobacteriia bacterium]|nr:c-type cytochrome [Terriglobia bacterium]
MRLSLSLLALFLTACGSSRQGWLPPEEALKSFRLSEDFRIELFAAEPEIQDPVDMVFDDQGRAYVAEMLDLPYDPSPGKPARSRIRMLEDTNGDGRADRNMIWADNLLQVSGLMPWKGGMIVPAAPQILYLKDTDGDGRADLRQVLFTGFYQGNPEGQITNPRLAIDNWIYFSNAGNEGLIQSPAHPDRPAVQVRGADFRYHPLRGLFEAASGPAQYGSTFDDWGNRFISQNTTHLRHVVLPRHYLARAPLLNVPAVVEDVYGDFPRKMYPLTQPQHWRVERTRLRQERFDELKLNRIEHLSGVITGASGGTLYSGDAWPASYLGAIFTGDVSANLVRRDVLTPNGVTFTARPAKEGVEFLASTDPWFRPTSFANAPDGNLYMMDMQREFIETPLSVPEELRKEMDFYSGDQLGRIYRIVANKPLLKRPLKVNLGAASPAELVNLFEHPNGWHRATAHRLLIERQDKAAVPLLHAKAKQSGIARARLLALSVLDAMSALEEGDVLAALSDGQPQVREHAIRLAESLPHSEKMEAALLARRNDEDPRVRLQLAFTLGNFHSTAARNALAGLALSNSSGPSMGPWMRTAILSSVSDAPAAFLVTLRQKSKTGLDGNLVNGLGSLIGARLQPAEIQTFLQTAAGEKDPGPALAGLAKGLRMAGARNLKIPAAEASLEAMINRNVETAWELARFFELRTLTRRALREAANTQLLSEPARVRAIGALRGASYSDAAGVLEKILSSRASSAVQAAAVQTLGTFQEPSVAPLLIRHWKSYGPEARIGTVAALMASKDRLPLLLNALEGKELDVTALDVSSRNRLLEDRDPQVSARARQIFQTATAGRSTVIAAYKGALRLSGNPAQGKLVFAETCANCHMPRKQGARVGPDLSGISVKTKEELLAAILDPSAAIESRFVNYLVTTKDGRMYDGILASETPGAITLRGGAEEDVTLLRANISEIRSSSLSLMPEDLEKSLTKQHLADLIAYLRAGL